MNIGFLADLKATLYQRWFAVRVDLHAQVVLAAVNDSRDTKPWDSPDFDLMQNQNRLASPHLRGSRRRLGE